LRSDWRIGLGVVQCRKGRDDVKSVSLRAERVAFCEKRVEYAWHTHAIREIR
jgi:hypothetical protein